MRFLSALGYTALTHTTHILSHTPLTPTPTHTLTPPTPQLHPHPHIPSPHPHPQSLGYYADTPLHQKHSKISTFRGYLSKFGVLRRYPVTPKALKNLSFKGVPLKISGYYADTPLYQKHSKISNFEVPLKFWDIRSFGYLDAELTDTRRIGIMTSLS